MYELDLRIVGSVLILMRRDPILAKIVFFVQRLCLRRQGHKMGNTTKHEALAGSLVCLLLDSTGHQLRHLNQRFMRLLRTRISMGLLRRHKLLGDVGRGMIGRSQDDPKLSISGKGIS